MPKVPDGVIELRCKHCGTIHPLAYFRRYPKRPNLYGTTCKYCENEVKRNWYRKHRKKLGHARGERHYRAKKKWFDICILRSNPKIPGRALGRLLGIGRADVSRIRRGLAWRTQR